MTQRQTITINGKKYDAHTGLPVEQSSHVTAQPAQTHANFVKSKSHHSKDVHHRTQKSSTLNRRVVKKSSPQVAHKQAHAVTKSPAITKFAPHPTAPKRQVMSDIGPATHPVVQKVATRIAAKPAHTPVKKHVIHPQEHHAQHQIAPVVHKPSSVIKQEAIAKAMHEAPKHSVAKKHHKSSRKLPRLMSIASATLALLLLGGYFTYLNMPSLSVRVAAAQAGINASYPSYRPDGYSLDGPVAYKKGEVVMKFAANAGPQEFSVSQSKTSWDSTALKENYVSKNWGDDNLDTLTEHGLTIYTHDGNAAWVNGGILYTIDGDAPLSSTQLRHIATSL